jgi:DNA-binding NarL/FixJ family response regulator
MQPEGERPIRLLLAEGHSLVLAGLKRLLDEDPGIAVVGATTSGREALRLIREERPDLALLDVNLHEIGPPAILAHLREQGSTARILVLSGCAERHAVQEALLAGARGYVLKQGTSADLLHAIRSVRDGGLFVDAGVAEACTTAPPHAPAAAMRHGRRTLTPREEEVIRLIALGYTAKEIADQLGINARSVETMKARATDKLGLRNRARIVQYGVMRGWFRSALAVMMLLCADAPGASPVEPVSAKVRQV